MKRFGKSLVAIATTLTISLTAASAFAEYPTKPIKVIVPWSAGGDSDLSTRVWANAIEKELGTPVVVINKAGGGGIMGSAFVANSKNDGYTLLNVGLSNVLVTPNFSKTPYDFDSFTPIIKMTSVPLAIVVPADSPYKTLPEFVAGAQAGKVTQGSWGAASSATILANMIAGQLDYKVTYVHANSGAASMVSVIGGHIDSAVAFPPAFGPHVKSGRARALAMNNKMDDFPGVPTFAEFGVKGDFEGWSGIFAPKGVPAEVVEKLVAATEKAMKDPKVRQAFKNMNAVVDYRSGQEWIDEMKVTYNMMHDEAAKMHDEAAKMKK
ncbi:Bug family tripartite tricarboxylate transporter substrate binding protein [Desulfotalea psychrophila]|uniref:Tripartite tricarboxylate transporter substrate binding protein n=1 Tax=Desulfotalea psychrophila (strain LSv54 / DSM 12343) TaxID=177439 RepID=Q6AL03_DESPS|nr:tripartite tricarboxylate transporter substrate binding protein [Desulfotalea psychrophila]CAG36972.1 hypothetical protein DP2243 [Desulfotalea psychrophila LSv54]